MITARISPKGQITLPKKVRQALAVKPGQRVMFQVEPDGVLLKPLGPSGAEALAGSLRRYAAGHPSSEEVREKVRERVAHAAAQEG